ncbi:MAG: hypothetical protein AAF533_30810, partial [Acidobacteriota bacterium]
MAKDPKSMVTLEAFRVAPELLGTALARPWRRLMAQLVDLIAIALLSQVSSFVLGIGASLAFFWASRGRPSGRRQSWMMRWSLRGLGALIAFVTVSLAWSFYERSEEQAEAAQESVQELIAEADPDAKVAEVLEAAAATWRVSEHVGGSTSWAPHVVDEIVEALMSSGLDLSQLEEAAADIDGGLPKTLREAITKAWQERTGAGVVEDEEQLARRRRLAEAHLAALDGDDPFERERKGRELGEELLAQRLDRLETRVEKVTELNRGLADHLAEETEELSLLDLLRRFAEFRYSCISWEIRSIGEASNAAE